MSKIIFTPEQINLLSTNKYVKAISEKAITYTNFGHMKDKACFKSCKTFEEVRALIDDHIDYYNNHRSQWNMKKLTPVEYRNQLLSA